MVIGGWERDTRRATILSEIEEAFAALELGHLTDVKPFTTGPRRSVALLPFNIRAGEQESARKERMQQVLSGIMESDARTSAGKKLWAAFSKSKQQRQTGSHCAWARRALGAVSAELADQVDLENSTGTSWRGASLVGSSTLGVPPGTDMRNVYVDDRYESKPWFDLGALKRETKVAVKTLREALESTKR